MVRRKKEKRKRPARGIPKVVVLLATPEGWRFSIIPAGGGMLCGRLDIPINTAPEDARAAAAAKVVELARDEHETEVEVTWDPPPEPWSWTARVTLATMKEPPSPDTGGQTAS
ncbi:hypothetical protein [Streptomyces vinaceus]|uniref:hypothetical protein n=1 Tax=Streptomyces vinaceus TaxID=1960 RepID=UPI0037F11A9D